jgi:processive 1,2-diacylglycerol beta-glucosyltransferase
VSLSPILILTAAFGDGHNAAARGLAAALQLRGGHPVVADPFAESKPALNDFARRLYLSLINRAPHAWNLFYATCHRLPLIENTLFFHGAAQRRVEELLRIHRPRVVVLTFPVYAHLIARLPKDLRESFKLITVVTDSISVHRLWSTAPANLWIVPNEPTAAALAALGIAREKIQPIGFPVDPRFASPDPHSGDEPPGERPRILHLLNSGLRGGPELAAALASQPGWEVTIGTGRDPKIMHKVAEALRSHRDKVQLLGWTTEMPSILARNHFVIGKAGGALTQETIASRTPFLVTQVVPGQEEGNFSLLREIGVARLTPDGASAVQAIRESLRKNGKGWTEWKAKLAAASKPDASLRLADVCLGMVKS